MVFGNLDYNTAYSISPYITEGVITIIGCLIVLGSVGKSAQIGLHVWLPQSIEGLSISSTFSNLF